MRIDFAAFAETSTKSFFSTHNFNITARPVKETYEKAPILFTAPQSDLLSSLNKYISVTVETASQMVPRPHQFPGLYLWTVAEHQRGAILLSEKMC